MRLFKLSVLPLLCIAFTAVASEPGAKESLPALDCIINPSEKIELGSYSAGIIAEVLVKRGDRVVKDQVLARLDDRVEQASVSLARARAGIKSELEGGKVNLTYDRYAYQRLTDLYHTKAVSQQDKEQAERSVKLSSTSVKQAKEQSHIRELELSRAEALLDQRIIRSPVDGVVQRNLKFRGEYVDEQPVVQLVSLNPLYVETMVPIQFFGQLQVNSLAEIYPEVNSEQSIEARVIAIDPVGDVGSSAFGVQLEMGNADYSIPAGIKCDLKFTDQVAEAGPQETTVDLAESQPAAVVVAQKNAPLDGSATEVVVKPDLSDVAKTDVNKTEIVERQNEVVQPASVSLTQLVKLGPYTEEEFNQTAALLESEQISFTSETEVTKVKIGYILLLKGEKDSLHSAVTDLRHNGLKDIEYLSYGAYKDSVSLGVFYDDAPANSREKFVKGFGYLPERVARYRKQSLITVLAEVSEGRERLTSIGL